MRLALILGSLATIFGGIAYAAHLEHRRDLPARYRELNVAYFEGKLPQARVVYADNLPDNILADTYEEIPGTFVIEVRPGVDVDVLRHEACHVASWPEGNEHGPAWDRCMSRFGDR
jgi:hypothetical protein